MMRQGIRAIAMVVVVVHVVNETAHMCTQRLIDGQERLASATAIGLRLLQHEAEPAAIHRVLPPGGLRKKARESGFVGALQDAASHIGHALIGEDEQARQVVLDMSKLALVVN
jgi:hypothetical protein